jgi:cytochrome c oxidase subunit 2
MTRGSRNRRAVRAGGALVLSALLLAACSKNAPLDTLEPKGTNSRNIDNLMSPVFLIAGIVGLLVFGGSAYMFFKFRQRGEYTDEDFPNQLHGNFKLEIGWTILPAVILAAIAVPTMATLSKLNSYKKDDMQVVVIGQQWWWEYRYYMTGDAPKSYTELETTKADIVTATQMVIPIGKEVKITTTSRDVIHSHWIPALNGKRDAVPGRMAPWKLQADTPGVYFGQCTEFCGLSHSRMRMQVVALTQADFDRWVTDTQKPVAAPTPAMAAYLDQQRAIAKGEKIAADKLLKAPDSSAVERGMSTFRANCSSCHLMDGVNDDIYKGAQAALVSGAAPRLTHWASRTTYAGGIFNTYNADGTFDRGQLEAWLRNPPKEKPAYAQGGRGMPNLNLSEDQIDDLVALLQTTGKPPSPDVITQTEVQ